MRRRTFLALAGTGLAMGTAGCSGIGGGGDNGTTTTETETETNPDTTTDVPQTATTNAVTTTTAETPATMDGKTMTTMTGQPATLTGTTGNGSGGGSGGRGGSSVSGKITSVPDGLKITKQWFYRKQFSTGVRGILKNVSGHSFEYVEIRATFYNAQGKRLDTSLVHTTPLAAGEKWPFEVLYRGSRDPAQIARYTLVVDTSPF